MQFFFLLLSCGTSVFLQVYLLFVLIYYCCRHGCKRESKLAEELKKSWLAMKVAIIIFPLLEFPDSNNEKIPTLLKQKVPVRFFLNLYLSVTYVILSAVSVFWQEFFIQEIQYQEGLESATFCFHKPYLFKPSVNCSEMDCSSMNVVCFDFVFAFGSAFTAAAGVLSVYFGLLSVLSVYFMLLQAQRPSHSTATTRCKCCFTVGSVAWILLMVIMNTVIAMIYLFRIKKNATYYILVVKVHYFIILLVEFLLVAFSGIKWWKLASQSANDEDKDVQQSDNDEDVSQSLDDEQIPLLGNSSKSLSITESTTL